MGYKDIRAGDKIAKPLAARFVKSKKGTQGCEVIFEFEEPSTGAMERLNWVGWLSPAALENTMDTLVNVLGFNGNDAIDDQGNLTDPGALAYQKQVKLVVEIESYTNDKGESRSGAKIKWVNALGGSAFQACEPQTIKSELAGLGFRAAFLAAKQSAGKPKETVSEKEIPF